MMPEWGAQVNSWTNGSATQVWRLCFSSFTNDTSTSSPAVFHLLCGAHNTTVSVAHTALGYTFGGYVRLVPFLVSFSARH